MLFPIGINQSSAQTIMSTTVMTPTLDFEQYAEIINPCLTDGVLTPTATGISGVIHSVIGVTCFEDDVRTWQAHILNADNDGIIYSTGEVMATMDNVDHSISFDALMPATDYRIVTIFTGAYTSSFTATTPTFADATVYRVTTFATSAASLVTANTHTVTLPNLFAPIVVPITDTVIMETLLDGTTFGTSSLANVMFTTNGTIGSDGVASTGNASGTLTVTNPTMDNGPIFHHTPNSEGLSSGDYPYIEAFAYTATLNSDSGSSTLYIVVPAPTCAQDVSTVRVNFIVLADGETDGLGNRVTISNTGNSYNQPMIRGADSTGGEWRSGDGTKIMDAGQTRYNNDNTVTYSDRTPITTTSAIINNANLANVDRVKAGNPIVDTAPLGENDQSISPFNGRLFLLMQLLVDLDDPTFEGVATQELTISSDCS